MRTSDFGAVGDGLTDDTAALQAALDAAEGSVLEFAPGCYVTGRLNVRSGTLVVMSPDVSLKKRVNAGGILRVVDASGVRIHGNGATIYGDDPAGSTAYSHTLAFLGASDCEARDLIVDGASAGGGGKDCIYVGAGAAACDNVRIIGVKALRAKRNGISVVAGHRTLIEDVEAAYANGAPGAGIDVEANAHGQVSGTVIRRAHCHHNSSSGIINSFGAGTLIERCELHDNAAYGIGISSGGGAVFAEGVYRPNVDVIGVTGFDTATGVVFVAAQPPVGTPVMLSVRNGAAKPPEFSGTYMIVSRHVGTNGVILGSSVRRGEVKSCSAGSGVMDSNPAVSDVRLLAFVDGQSDNCTVFRSSAYRNGQHGIIVIGAGKCLISESNFYGNLGYSQAWVGVTKDIEIDRCQFAGGGIGLVAQRGGGYLRITRSAMDGTGSRGLALSDWTGAEVDRNALRDCAASEPGSSKAALHISACLRPSVTHNTVTQAAANTTTLYGIYAEGSVENGTFTGNDLTGAGTTPANALRIMSPTCTVSGNIGRDGLPL